ncbi:MAG: RNA-directed DNA polymerase [Bacteroidales bacterium]|nr:RNA-directed DNA polymerase [Bacteroidales bacterium]
MSIAFPLLLNGRATGVSALVKNKIVHALAASSEYNSNNAWNMNFSNGNLNNNNKYNNNYVRAVAALSDKEIQCWIDAFEDCCKKKKSSGQCTFYRAIYEDDLITLAAEVKSHTYEPSKSICFVVTRPKLREVFAANFRDRIVQHWACLRLNPLFEERFHSQGDVSFNCRVGYGTLHAVQTLQDKIKKVSQNYTRQAYIGKFDLKAFFMSIDKNILQSMISDLIDSKYIGEDKEDLHYVCTKIIMHCPQKYCVKRGNERLWDDLDPRKSLFNAPDTIGMPIGNLTSQLFANYYMSFFDEWILHKLKEYGGEYIRFVDDFSIVVPTTDEFDGKEIIKQIRKEAILWLKEHLHLTLHADKVYIQDVKKGVAFVGSVLKPNRLYISNRSVASMKYKLKQFDEFCFDLACSGHEPTKMQSKLLEHDVCSLNSYLGGMVHDNSYAIRSSELLNKKWFWKYCYVSGHFQCIKLKNKYKLKYRVLR